MSPSHRSAGGAEIRLRGVEHARLRLRTRIPFRYGITTLSEVDQLILSATFSIGGREVFGLAADNLAPKWFKKDPAQAVADELVEMLNAIRTAVRHATDITAPSAFAFWQQLHARQSAWADATATPPLLAHFGTALVERTLIDAVARANGTNFAAALNQNVFALDLGAIHPELSGSTPAAWLGTPLNRVFARHTVGLADPIDDGDIATAERLNDGLPQTLTECIRFYGLRHFKIKLEGHAERDRDRLRRVHRVITAECRDDFAFSLDANEAFRDAGVFTEYARGLFALPDLREWWRHLMFVEQPLHRAVALQGGKSSLADAWSDRPPVVIDESDAEITSLPTALTLGYAGTSHKNCKGIFKGVANACLLARRRMAGQPALLTGEDLNNTGPLALLPDLAVQAVLGAHSVERNGHHYYNGLAQFPAALQAETLAQHGDLFTRTAQGWPRLDIRGGELVLGTVNAAPLGFAGDPQLAGFEFAPFG